MKECHIISHLTNHASLYHFEFFEKAKCLLLLEMQLEKHMRGKVLPFSFLNVLQQIA